jgi:hypothetical protein
VFTVSGPSQVLTITATLAYLALVITARYFFIATNSRSVYRAHLASTWAQIQCLPNNQQACATQLLVEAASFVPPQWRPETPDTNPTQISWNLRNRFADFLTLAGGRPNEGWALLNDIDRMVVNQLTSPVLAAEAARQVVKLSAIGTQRATVAARSLTAQLVQPTPQLPPTGIVEPGQTNAALRHSVVAALELTQRHKAAQYGSAAALQRRAFFLTIVATGLIVVFLLSSVYLPAVVLLGSLGGLVSRLVRLQTAANESTAATDYGLKWSSIFLAPLLGALGSIGALTIIAALTVIGALGDKTFGSVPRDLFGLTSPSAFAETTTVSKPLGTSTTTGPSTSNMPTTTQPDTPAASDGSQANVYIDIENHSSTESVSYLGLTPGRFGVTSLTQPDSTVPNAVDSIGTISTSTRPRAEVDSLTLVPTTMLTSTTIPSTTIPSTTIPSTTIPSSTASPVSTITPTSTIHTTPSTSVSMSSADDIAPRDTRLPARDFSAPTLALAFLAGFSERFLTKVINRGEMAFDPDDLGDAPSTNPPPIEPQPDGPVTPPLPAAPTAGNEPVRIEVGDGTVIALPPSHSVSIKYDTTGNTVITVSPPADPPAAPPKPPDVRADPDPGASD